MFGCDWVTREYQLLVDRDLRLELFHAALRLQPDSVLLEDFYRLHVTAAYVVVLVEHVSAAVHLAEGADADPLDELVLVDADRSFCVVSSGSLAVPHRVLHDGVVGSVQGAVRTHAQGAVLQVFASQSRAGLQLMLLAGRFRLLRDPRGGREFLRRGGFRARENPLVVLGAVADELEPLRVHFQGQSLVLFLRLSDDLLDRPVFFSRLRPST